MRRSVRFFSTVAPVGWLLVAACGGRTELLPGGVAGAAGSTSGAPAPLTACVTADDCAAPPAEQCGSAVCVDGACSLALGQRCDDGDPCTTDSCLTGSCVFTSARVDADGDGVFASGNQSDPRAALGCGNDCDDSSPAVHPGALELCDALDNDCNGVIDDGAQLVVSSFLPSRVSPADATRSWGTGLAFDGGSFGVTMTSLIGRNQSQFQQLSATGLLLGAPQRIAHVNAESFGGPLVWSGERYLTGYQDARQDGNYEIYFDLLNRQGERLIEDLRVTNADDYSLRPSVLWTGAEGLLLWDDRRFEGSGDASVIFGQRVSRGGQLIGANLRLSPPGMSGENAAAALLPDGLGIAFVALDSAGSPRLEFMTASRTLTSPSAPTQILFDDPDGPVVTALNDEYVLTFHQDSGVIGPAIYGVVIGKNGAMLGSPQSMTAGSPHARGNATFSYGDRFVMVWADDREGMYQLYAQTFNQKLSPISAPLRLTTTMSNTLSPIVAASSDGGLGVLYTDDANATQQTFFTRLDCRVPNIGLK